MYCPTNAYCISSRPTFQVLGVFEEFHRKQVKRHFWKYLRAPSYKKKKSEMVYIHVLYIHVAHIYFLSYMIKCSANFLLFSLYIYSSSFNRKYIKLTKMDIYNPSCDETLHFKPGKLPSGTTVLIIMWGRNPVS